MEASEKALRVPERGQMADGNLIQAVLAAQESDAEELLESHGKAKCAL